MAAPRILVTRSPHQASPLADALRARGLNPILIPAIELVDPSSFASLDHAIADLGEYHWLLFTSANAVEAFARRRNSPIPAGLRVAAIGHATAKAIEKKGLRVGLIPSKAVAESFAEALLPHTKQPNGTPTRFLLVRAEAARDHLPDALREAGAEVEIAPAYRTIVPERSVLAVRELFASKETCADAITFTSSSSVANLLALLEVSGLTLPPESLRVSIGPITSKTLKELGLPAHAESPQPTMELFADTVLSLLRSKDKL